MGMGMGMGMGMSVSGVEQSRGKMESQAGW